MYVRRLFEGSGIDIDYSLYTRLEKGSRYFGSSSVAWNSAYQYPSPHAHPPFTSGSKLTKRPDLTASVEISKRND
jgi:hypothetical protein